MNRDWSRVIVRSLAALVVAATFSAPVRAQTRGPYSSSASPWEGMRDGSPDRRLFDAANRRTPGVSVYFPPNPPPLGVEVVATGETRAAASTPGELAAYITEPFYVPLSVRLHSGIFSRLRREQLDQFHTTRTALLEQLRETLRAVEGHPPGVRQAALAAFARQQTAQIAELERVAEELRRTLIDRGWLSTGVAGDWGTEREWKLGRGELAQPRAQTRLFELQVTRAAAFYQEGLAPAQRRLLREAAMEFEDEIFRPAETKLQFFIYLSPETARVRLPHELPPALAEQVDEYRAAKDELKMQLRDLVYEMDAVSFAAEREQAFRQLSAQQAPRVAALETRAPNTCARSWRGCRRCRDLNRRRRSRPGSKQKSRRRCTNCAPSKKSSRPA